MEQVYSLFLTIFLEDVYFSAISVCSLCSRSG